MTSVATVMIRKCYEYSFKGFMGREPLPGRVM